MAPVLVVCLVSIVITKVCADISPLSQVVDLLVGLSAKITKEGEVEAHTYDEYVKWCKDRDTDDKFAIRTATSEKAKLEAHISELGGLIQASVSKIEDLSGSIAAGTAELKDATAMRDRENGDFVGTEKELVEAIDTIGRAVTILQRELRKNPSAFAQIARSSAGILQSLSAVVDAASFSAADQARLKSLLQTSKQLDDNDEDLGAPQAAVYQSHSSDIIDVLQDLKEKAEEQLSTLRKAEVNSRHSFEMLKQSLEDETSANNKDLASHKTSKASNEEAKAAAEGDLKATIANLKATEEALATATATCSQVSANHDATVAARNNELKVISEAIDILRNTTTGAAGQTYSFLQISSGIRSRADLKRAEVLTFIRRLAKQQHSSALAQLASQISALCAGHQMLGEGPFAKVKELISNLIERLQAEASADATEKSFCDSEMAKTDAKRSELDAEASKLTTQIDQAVAKSNELKREVAQLAVELSTLLAQQSDMDKLRQDSHAQFIQAKADLEQGLAGVRRALVVLRDYYAAGDAASLLIQGSMEQPTLPKAFEASVGAGTSIIGLLEVVLGDFATNLAKEATAEDSAQADYETMTQRNKITKAAKDQDVKYKNLQCTDLDKKASELTSDLQNTNAELAAIVEYDTGLKGRCIAKPETYETRRQRRQAEIAGLKEALAILTEETAFVQKGIRRKGNMRGLLNPIA